MSALNHIKAAASDAVDAAKTAAQFAPLALALGCQPGQPTAGPAVAPPPLSAPETIAKPMRFEPIQGGQEGGALEYTFTLDGPVEGFEGQLVEASMEVRSRVKGDVYHDLPEGVVFQASADGMPSGPHFAALYGSQFIVGGGSSRDASLYLMACAPGGVTLPAAGSSLTVEGEISPRSLVQERAQAIIATGSQEGQEAEAAKMVDQFCADVDGF